MPRPKGSTNRKFRYIVNDESYATYKAINIDYPELTRGMFDHLVKGYNCTAYPDMKFKKICAESIIEQFESLMILASSDERTQMAEFLSKE